MQLKMQDSSTGSCFHSNHFLSFFFFFFALEKVELPEEGKNFTETIGKLVIFVKLKMLNSG